MDNQGEIVPNWETDIWYIGEILPPSQIGRGTLTTEQLLNVVLEQISLLRTVAELNSVEERKQVDRMTNTLKWTRRLMIAVGSGTLTLIVQQVLHILGF